MSEHGEERASRDPAAKPVLEWTPEEWQAWIETTRVPPAGPQPPAVERSDDWWDRLAGEEAETGKPDESAVIDPAPAAGVAVEPPAEAPVEPPAPVEPVPPPPLEPPPPVEPPPPPVEPPPPPVEPPQPVEPVPPPVTPPAPPISRPRPEAGRSRRPVDPRPHRARSGLALLAVSVTVGVVTAFLVAVSITVAVLALKRAVG